MTFEEMEKSLVSLQDNQVVQGHLLHRVEQVQDRNAEAIGKLADGFILPQAAMKGLVETAEQNSVAIARNGENISKLDEGLAALQTSLKRLADTVDRFLKGLGGDGRRRRS